MPANRQPADDEKPILALIALLLDYVAEELYGRYKTHGTLVDLHLSVSACNLAVECTHTDSDKFSSHLWSHALTLITRFERLGKLADVDAGIFRFQRVVELTPEGHPDKPRLLNSLGLSLAYRFERLGELSDIKPVVYSQYQSIDLSLHNCPSQSVFLLNLGIAWLSWLRHSPRSLHFRVAYNCFSAATCSSFGSPKTKLRAALNAASLCSEFPHLVISKGMVLQAHKNIVDAIPSFIWLGQSVSHRFIQLSHFKIGRIISAAASAALTSNEVELALEWLEEGRSIIWTQLDRLQMPLDSLRLSQPNLANAFEQTSASLRAAGGGRAALKGEDEVRLHHELAAKYDQLLVRIRTLEGFENFLRPKVFPEFAPACQHGPIVVINVHSSRCDALVLCSPGHVVHTPLPGLSINIAKNMHKQVLFCTGGTTTYRDGREILRVPGPENYACDEFLDSCGFASYSRCLVRLKAR
jgi:hypothetical protein